MGDHPDPEWIGEYAGRVYQGVASAARKHLDELAAGGMTERRAEELVPEWADLARVGVRVSVDPAYRLHVDR